MKTFIAAIAAKMMTWLIHGGIGWVKGQTPEAAMAMRRRTKAKVLAQKDKARKTTTEADDIAPMGADVYMGFATMRAAQRKIAEICTVYCHGAENPDAVKVLHITRDAIRILDESEGPE